MPTTDPSILSHHLGTMIAILHGGYARILPDVLHVGLLLLTLDAVLMGLWWALDGGENVLSLLVRWILWSGLLAGTIYTWPLWSWAFAKSLLLAGLTIGGSGLTVQQFLDPMAVFQHGWELCVVIMATWATHMGLSAMMHPGDLFMMGLAFLGILLAHFLLAAEVFLTVLEFTLLTICSTILLPFGFLRYTWFLCEMAIKNLVVLSVRLLVLAAVVSLISPVMTQLLLPSQPTLKDAFGAAVISGMCALLAWHAPHMAASMVGGVAILTGQATVRTVQTAVQVATLGTVQRLRRQPTTSAA
jgi:type IV secretion system protein TrbL